jgi:hypothetical protein
MYGMACPGMSMTSFTPEYTMIVILIYDYLHELVNEIVVLLLW